MALSMTTDYAASTGCPEPYLQAIAEAGFTHVHWCHQWNTDFAYAPPELRQARAWLKAFGLRLLDLHGSAGQEKSWWSLREYERLAGVELVANRMWFASRLGADVVIMHLPSSPAAPPHPPTAWDQVRRSLDALRPVAAQCGVRIALENMADDDFALHRQLFAEYADDYLGLCYDSGHGNLGARRGLEQLETLRDRLLAVHLHDNDGSTDQHLLPFAGTVDWLRLARALAGSAYRKCVSLEATWHRVPEEARPRFLADAHRTAALLAGMIAPAAA
jgi:sugar phosphate isomerase/epimerase